MKKFYSYLFYRFYKLMMLNEFKWLPVFRATLFLLALEMWLLMSIAGFINLIFDTQIIPRSFFNWYSLIIGLFLIWLKHYCFDKDDKWKAIVEEFDVLPRRKQVFGIILFIGTILFVIGCFVLMLYLTGKKSGTIQ